MFTSDGPCYFMLNGGSLAGMVAAVNFGSNPKGNFELLRQFSPNQPLFCCEYWNGWFDHWYEEHHTRGAGDTADVLKEMLDLGASVNFYMFHGGTNFGFNNGANYENGIQPTVTSYDYNCPLSENGDMTEKYDAIRKVIQEFNGYADETPVENQPRCRYGTVALTESAVMFEQLDSISTSVTSPWPQTMEQLGQDFGFVLYTTTLSGPFETMDLSIDRLHDRAIVYLDGTYMGIKERTGKRNDTIRIGLKRGETARLSILVENLGRINYGPKIKDAKGILGNVRIGPLHHFGWTMHPLPCRDLSTLSWSPVSPNLSESLPDCGPVFLRGELTVEEPMDTFVRLDGFEKGNVWINGFNLGRYWNSAGPQKTLYLPGPLLNKGANELVVLELQQCDSPEILLTNEPELG